MEEERGQPTIQLCPPKAQSNESQSLSPAAEKRTKTRLREGGREGGKEEGRKGGEVGEECFRELFSCACLLLLFPFLPLSLLTAQARGGNPGVASSPGGLWT